MSSTAATAGAQTQVNAFGFANAFINTEAPVATLWHTDHTPLTTFAFADVRVDFNGTASFGSRVAAELDRPADLVSTTSLRYTLRAWTVGAGVAAAFPEDSSADNYHYTDDVGNACIEEFELIVGNNRFDVADGIYFHMYDEECMPEGKQSGVETGKYNSTLGLIEASRFDQDLIIPIYSDLLMWPGKAIEAVGISKQKIRMNFTFRPLSRLIRTTGAAASTAYDLGLTTPADANAIVANGSSNVLQDAHLQVHYVWLTQAERNAIINGRTMTLYREVQKAIEIDVPAAASQVQTRQSFNNPCNDIFFAIRLNSKWDIQSADATQRGYNWFDFSGVDQVLGGTAVAQLPSFQTHSLNINNTQRYSATPNYLDHHIAKSHYARKGEKGVHKYPFGRHPCSEHPTGSLNFSMIDHQDFRWTFNSATQTAGVILMYMRTWNIATRADGVLHKELQSQ